MKTFYFVIFSSLTLLIFSCKKEQLDVPSVIGIAKDIDDNSYNYTEIMGDDWMIQNLNTSRFRNGDTILRVVSAQGWKDAYFSGTPVWTYYNNDSVMGAKYGKLYNWFALNDTRGIAPDGWHVATKSEWINLRESYGGDWAAGYYLKSNSNDWLNEGAGNNESRFSALPGGKVNHAGNTYGFGGEVWFWTSTIETPATPFSNFAALMPSANSLLNITTRNYDHGAYIRCVKD